MRYALVAALAFISSTAFAAESPAALPDPSPESPSPEPPPPPAAPPPPPPAVQETPPPEAKQSDPAANESQPPAAKQSDPAANESQPPAAKQSGPAATESPAPVAEPHSTATANEVPPVPAPRVITETINAMGTRLQIQVYADDEPEARVAIQKAYGEIARVEALLSDWRAESDISRLNAHAGKEAVPVSADTLRVLRRAEEINRISGGAFAVTWAALSSLWRFDAGDAAPRLPDPVRLNARLKLVDDSRLTIDETNATAKLETEGMAVGLGGVGKGYAIDRALAVLSDAGFPNALVFIGGDIGVSGAKGKAPWVIGIQDPRGVGFFAVLAAKNEAVITSGDYQRFFELDGKRYHHILDPRTGMPATGVRSATVVAEDATTADALATALFVLGPDDGMKLIESQPGVEGMIVDANNEVILTSGLKERMRVVREPTD